jgi:hypothetical protein
MFPIKSDFSTAIKERIKDNDTAIPVMIHLDSYGVHTTGEIGSII